MKAKESAANAISSIKDWLTEYAYLVTLGAVIAVVAASAMYAGRLREEQAKSLAAAAQAAETQQTDAPKPSPSPLPTIAPVAFRQTSFAPRIVTVRPVGGEIVRAYAREPVLWKTLDAYQAHEAIDIAGEADGPVFSAMDGVTASAAMDALWGWKVVIAHTDGSTGVYAGLGAPFVRAGESVSRGQEIGLLMEAPPCEAELGPHLHFALMKNGAWQDPEGVLPE